MLHQEGLDKKVMELLNIPEIPCDLTEWESMVQRLKTPVTQTTIAIVGKYVDLPDAYLSVVESLIHGGIHHHAKVNVRWVSAEDVTMQNAATLLKDVDGIVVPGGFGSRGLTGLNRREAFVDASKIRSTFEDTGDPIPEAKYSVLLLNAGKEELSKHVKYKNFTSEVDNLSSYIYGKDYYVGDIVQVVDDLGHGAVVRISEVIVSLTSSGQKIYPGFQIIEDETYINN